MTIAARYAGARVVTETGGATSGPTLGVELLERDVDGARQMLGGVLLGRQHVDKLDAVRE